MKHVLMASALALAAAAPAYAGGGGGTVTSYTPTVSVSVQQDPPTIVYVGGYHVPECLCDCNGNLQLAMNVGTRNVVYTENTPRRLEVWSN